MMEQELTMRGFQILQFIDRNMQPCQLQQSSAIDDTERGMSNPGSSFVWLGVGDSDRMHLSREQVTQLIDAMQHWLNTGKLF